VDDSNPVNVAYEQEVFSAIRAARKLGFIVDAALCEAPQCGGGSTRFNPEHIAVAATRLAEEFKDDRGVTIEYDSEPWGVKGGWPAYIAAVNDITARVRSTGAENVVLVAALDQDFGAYWGAQRDYPYGTFTDRAQQLAFALHPYFPLGTYSVKQQDGTYKDQRINFVGATPEQWEKRFGAFSREHPVVATEWSENTNVVGNIPSYCAERPYGLGAPVETPHEFLQFLQTGAHINGVIGWAADLPGTLTWGYEGKPTILPQFCNPNAGGVGAELFDFFKNDQY
jgi:hypothetical protein